MLLCFFAKRWERHCFDQGDCFVVVALHFYFTFKINAVQNHVEWGFLCYGL